MKYIPSIAFEEMSGSAKGVTAAKMKNRKYIRNRGYGGSVRTSDQAKVKGIFKRLTTMWKSLSNENILAWNKLALSQQGRSVLGTGAKISGANLFTRLNYWIVACGGSPLMVCQGLLKVGLQAILLNEVLMEDGIQRRAGVADSRGVQEHERALGDPRNTVGNHKITAEVRLRVALFISIL